MSESICKGCGKKVIWGISGDGKMIPLDPSPPIYTISGFASTVDSRYREIARANVSDFMVSHFSTCPEANRFSGSKRS